MDMEDFVLELRALDETQDRVEAVSDEILRAHTEREPARAAAMVDKWMDALRASGLDSERVAFLYVANHVLQKTLYGGNALSSGSGEGEIPDLANMFGAYMEEAVSLVSNSPMDRQNVTRLLELWHEKDVYPDEMILRMWRCTGEDLPSFLQALAASSASNGGDGDNEQSELEDSDHELRHETLPMKLNAHSANPAVDALKEIDRHKAVLQYLERVIMERHQYVLTHAVPSFQSADDILADRTTSAVELKRRVEECLRLVKIRNKYMAELPTLKQQLAAAITKMKQDEINAGSKIEQKLEQCDLIDIGLADLAEHRDAYPEEWSKEAYACSLRRRRKDEEQRQREEEMVRLHHEAIAESAKHALHLEADMNASTSGDLQSLSKDLGAAQPVESKPEATNEMVWHPVLKELVPLKSLNVEWESWRDH